MKVLVNIRSHIALQHMFISESFADQKLFNISADAEVNSYIENLPKDACTAKWIGEQIGKQLENGLGTKKYYEEIQNFMNKQQKANAQNPQKPCNGGQGGSSSQNQQSNSQSSQSNSSPSDASSDESQEDNEQEENQTPPSPSQEEKQESDNQSPEKDNSQNENKEQQERGNDEEQENPYPDEFKASKAYDSHDTWKDFKDVPEATQQLMQNTINNIIKATAEQVEKMRGTIPGELSEIIEKLREKKPEVFNWKAYFRRMLGSIYDVNIKSTRRKESKRFEGAAGIQHKKKVSILVAIDTSGSVSNRELQEFFSEIDYAYKAGARITIIQCDTRINGIEDYDGTNIPQIKGRGGTEFDPPVDYYVEHRKEYASLIYFTDGEAPLPRKRPSGMVWVISSLGNSDQDFPGKVIKIPKETPNDN